MLFLNSYDRKTQGDSGGRHAYHLLDVIVREVFDFLKINYMANIVTNS